MLYDIIIIGAGVAGYSAGIYAARFNLKTLIIGKRLGGLLQDTHIIENYPGYKSIPGYELVKKLKEHVENYNIKLTEDEVIDVKKNKDRFIIKTRKKKYIGKSIIFATGTERKKLDIKNAKKFEAKGISYCALCDGPLFKNKIVGVIGGSDSAAKEALFLSKYAKRVYIIHRKNRIRTEPINFEKLKNKKKIKIINNTNIINLTGKKYLKSVVLDRPYKGNKELKLDCLFIEIGHIPGSILAKKLGVKLNKKREIIIDKYSKTNIKGVCAAGDVTNMDFKQAIIGAAQGAIAAFSCYNYLNKKKQRK